MKKTLVLLLGAMLILSSCGTYTGAGAVTGGSFGSIIGSAIGGIAGGWRGSDVGSLIGMAGGAVVGAAVGSAADKAEQRRYEDYAEQRRQRRIDNYGSTRSERTERVSPQYDDYSEQSGFDANNGGDDRLIGFDENLNSTAPSAPSSALPKSTSILEIRNAQLLDTSRDGVLSRGEEARMVFEVFNTSSKPVYQVQPTVAEVTSNKHIYVSENVLVESILPGRGIRYTAVIKADNRLKDGEAVIRISVLHENKEIASQSRVFTIQTSR